jgi:hypothetical protein
VLGLLELVVAHDHPGELQVLCQGLLQAGHRQLGQLGSLRIIKIGVNVRFALVSCSIFVQSAYLITSFTTWLLEVTSLWRKSNEENHWDATSVPRNTIRSATHARKLLKWKICSCSLVSYWTNYFTNLT